MGNYIAVQDEFRDAIKSCSSVLSLSISRDLIFKSIAIVCERGRVFIQATDTQSYALYELKDTDYNIEEDITVVLEADKLIRILGYIKNDTVMNIYESYVTIKSSTGVVAFDRLDLPINNKFPYENDIDELFHMPMKEFLNSIYFINKFINSNTRIQEVPLEDSCLYTNDSHRVISYSLPEAKDARFSFYPFDIDKMYSFLSVFRGVESGEVYFYKSRLESRIYIYTSEFLSDNPNRFISVVTKFGKFKISNIIDNYKENMDLQIKLNINLKSFKSALQILSVIAEDTNRFKCSLVEDKNNISLSVNTRRGVESSEYVETSYSDFEKLLEYTSLSEFTIELPWRKLQETIKTLKGETFCMSIYKSESGFNLMISDNDRKQVLNIELIERVENIFSKSEDVG